VLLWFGGIGSKYLTQIVLWGGGELTGIGIVAAKEGGGGGELDRHKGGQVNMENEPMRREKEKKVRVKGWRKKEIKPMPAVATHADGEGKEQTKG